MAKAIVNRSELIREALGTGLSTSNEVIEHVKKLHGVAVTVALVNNVKSNIKTKAAKARKAKSASKPMVPSVPAKTLSHALTVGDITEVKELLRRIGGDTVKQLIQVLA